MPQETETGVVVLAGGEATRFPGKLAGDAGGLSLLRRVIQNVGSLGPVYLSVHRDFSEDALEERGCTIVRDRFPARGPLEGLIATFRAARESTLFVVAGDAPFADAKTYRELVGARESGDEAVLAQNAAGIIEPLCALYDRASFLREAGGVHGDSGVVDVAKRLRYRCVSLSDGRALINVNTPAQLHAVFP